MRVFYQNFCFLETQLHPCSESAAQDWKLELALDCIPILCKPKLLQAISHFKHDYSVLTGNLVVNQHVFINQNRSQLRQFAKNHNSLVSQVDSHVQQQPHTVSQDCSKEGFIRHENKEIFLGSPTLIRNDFLNFVGQLEQDATVVQWACKEQPIRQAPKTKVAVGSDSQAPNSSLTIDFAKHSYQEGFG